jgi:hydrogenase nickel incorporation protein HypA/HybF
MHEVGLMQNTMKLALDSAQAQGAAEIHALRLRVGVLSGIVPDALQFAFEILRRGTMAAGARLIVEDVPAGGYCSACRREFAIQNYVFECPDCHGTEVQIVRGRELELVSLEIS